VPKVLVIDDSPMMSDYICRCLERSGFESERWLPLSAMDIPDKVAASSPALVIADYQMPGCNGATVAKMVKRSNPEIPVMILTAFRDEEVQANLLKFGVKRIIYKPIKCEELVAAVKEFAHR